MGPLSEEMRLSSARGSFHLVTRKKHFCFPCFRGARASHMGSPAQGSAVPGLEMRVLAPQQGWVGFCPFLHLLVISVVKSEARSPFAVILEGPSSSGSPGPWGGNGSAGGGLGRNLALRGRQVLSASPQTSVRKPFCSRSVETHTLAIGHLPPM